MVTRIHVLDLPEYLKMKFWTKAKFFIHFEFGWRLCHDVSFDFGRFHDISNGLVKVMPAGSPCSMHV